MDDHEHKLRLLKRLLRERNDVLLTQLTDEQLGVLLTALIQFGEEVDAMNTDFDKITKRVMAVLTPGIERLVWDVLEAELEARAERAKLRIDQITETIPSIKQQ